MQVLQDWAGQAGLAGTLRCCFLSLAWHSAVQPGRTVEGTGVAEIAWAFDWSAWQPGPRSLTALVDAAPGGMWAEHTPEWKAET